MKTGQELGRNWAGTVGKFGCGNTNDRGLQLLEFACSKDHAIANTLYPHKRSRITTWHSPDWKTHNQINYVLTPQLFMSSINKPKTRTGADVGTDHDVVMKTINLRLQKNWKTKNPKIRFDVEKLQDPTHLKATIRGRFTALNFMKPNINNTVNSIWRQQWVPNDVSKLCDQR